MKLKYLLMEALQQDKVKHYKFGNNEELKRLTNVKKVCQHV